MSKYSGKCDIYDSLIMIREMNEDSDWSKVTIKQYTDELDAYGYNKVKELKITSLKDVVPYFPFIEGSAYYDNTGIFGIVIIIGQHSYVYEEEHERLQNILDEAKKHYRKCKRKNEEFIPQEIAKKLNICNAYSKIYLEICNRVKEHPCSASIDDLHMPYFNYERDMLIDTMMQYGYSKKEAYEWCYNENKLW